MASEKNSRSAWMAGKSSLAESAPPRAMMRLRSARGGGSKSAKSGCAFEDVEGVEVETAIVQDRCVVFAEVSNSLWRMIRARFGMEMGGLSWS